ncbi:Uncharacterised protein [Vibrio cholerae]|uniref:Uncharacterized protein n=1 Tax=Vibrio cholerae TaxID=666 RepID=A0A655WV15_VIBCL|nr:Uncharacterised protein [Vibrio cholerae]CSB99247.1 Uncharacterised protein [Vibrio cholerae]CSC84684.1 Uncharacterised protein [Vibrio cholerae]CSD08163.1 Uncharacterised protein [Vibrio cholerae]CSI66188.1 Uncharacterised protein [Vibrio cholerae]
MFTTQRFVSTFDQINCRSHYATQMEIEMGGYCRGTDEEKQKKSPFLMIRR